MRNKFENSAICGCCGGTIGINQRDRRRKGRQHGTWAGTVTSAELAQQRLPPGVIHQFVPLDAPRFVTRFLDHWRPDLALFVESDLWPNLVLASAARHVPLVLVNGRLSQRSFSRWGLVPSTIGALLQRLDLCLAQSPADAKRYAALGGPRVAMTGNLKLDVPAPPVDANELQAIKSAIGERMVVAAASTHPGEDIAVLDAHRGLRQRFPELLTIIVPRHPHRGPEIADLALAAGLTAALRSRGEKPDMRTEIYVADTVGELGLVYRLAPIVFMGGSLVAKGGHNVLEPARYEKAIVFGPHMENFRDITRLFLDGNAAIQIHSAAELAPAIEKLLTNASLALELGRNARAIVEQNTGATDRVLKFLKPIEARR
jgi:3-deoxy-D-manno-octulosonic-acid transferase